MEQREKNWAGFTYPAMLRDSIRRAKKWDMQHRVNRWELRKMQIRYWLWWKWVPIPTAMIGALIGVGLFNGAVALFGW